MIQYMTLIASLSWSFLIKEQDCERIQASRETNENWKVNLRHSAAVYDCEMFSWIK